MITAFVITSVAAAAQTPVATSVRSKTIENTSGTASEMLFATNTAPLESIDGVSGVWVPVSIRYVYADSLYVFAELRNDSDTAQLSPRLNIELSTGGTSFGITTIAAENAWSPAGSSVFYKALNVFGGSLEIGDWDTQVLTLSAETYNDVETQDTENIRVQDGRVFNDGTTLIGPISWQEIIRDGDGIFTATCQGPAAGANIPPSKSVKVVGGFKKDHVGGCGFAAVGMPAAIALGHADTFTSDYVIGRVSAP